MALNSNPNYNEWMELYRKLVYWELEWKKATVLKCGRYFNRRRMKPIRVFKFISKNYASWAHPKSTDAPIMSHTLFRYKILPHVEKGKPLFVALIDNLRFDQWKAYNLLLQKHFGIQEEETFYSILPTATQYSRNAIFAGMMPMDIEKNFPSQWKMTKKKAGKTCLRKNF